MAKVTTTISLDADVKSEGVALLNSFGMDLSTAVGIFLTQTIRERRIPFEIREVPNAETRRAIENVRNGIELSRGFHSVSELMEDLYADD